VGPESPRDEILQVGGSVYASGVLNIAGFSNVADVDHLGQQTRLTSGSDISVRNFDNIRCHDHECQRDGERC
jgi:hypothetical protein